MDNPATTHRPRRRWLSFSLKSMLVFVTLVAIGAAWVAHERRQSRREIQIAEQLEAEGIGVGFAGPFDVPDVAPENQSWWRKRSATILGLRVHRISLTGTQISDLSPLAALESMKTLFLWDIPVTDLAPLAGLTNLESLHVSYAPISDLSALAGLTNLKTLSLTDTPVTDLSAVSGLAKLTSLGLTNTEVRDVAPLSGLKNLEGIDLNGTYVSDLKPLSGLKNLRWLWLRETSVSDLTPLSGLPNLEDLDAGGAPVTDEQVQKLKHALPNCKIER